MTQRTTPCSVILGSYISRTRNNSLKKHFVSCVPGEIWLSLRGEQQVAAADLDLDEAFRRATETDYGLSFSVFSQSEETFQRAMIEVPSGIVNWNRATNGASGRLPFGGVGKSGNHRPAALFAPEYCSYPVASLSKPFGEYSENPSPGFPQEVWK